MLLKLRWRQWEYRHMGYSASFLEAESISKETPHFLFLNAGTGFFNLNQKISPLSVQKNMSDGVGSQNGSIGTPLAPPPLFWLDNIFKNLFITIHQIRISVWCTIRLWGK
jgi:hypothetical protein